MKTLPQKSIEKLKSKVKGKIILPTDPGYNEVRKIWNAMIDRRPAVIVQWRRSWWITRGRSFTARAAEFRFWFTGNAYGVERFRSVVRNSARSTAQDILEAVYADIKAFTLGARQSDDITLVVAKLKEEVTPVPDWAI